MLEVEAVGENSFIHAPAAPKNPHKHAPTRPSTRIVFWTAVLVPFGPQAGSSVVLVTPDMPDGSPEVAEKGPLISGWGSSIVPVTCLYDAFVDVGPTKSKLCLSFLPVAAPKKHDIPLAINCE
jgi:hypothetical protein